MPATKTRTKGTDRVTIEDIGARLNISTSTVSRALRQDSLIHPETRARVKALAIDLGYQGRSRQGPNRGKKRNTIAVLFSSTSLAQVRSSYITTCYLQGLTTEAEAAGIALNLHTVGSTEPRDMEEMAGIPRSLLMEERDAVIVTGHHHDETVRRLAQTMPVVSLVWNYAGTNHDLVNTPDIAGMSLLIADLVRHGHRRLAWTEGIFLGSVQTSRKAGFIHGCLEQNLPLTEQYFFGPDLFNGTISIDAPKLLEAHRQGVTAFVCSSDYCARLVTDALQAAGVRVPEDASVTGFDHSMGASGAPTLTTIDPQFVEMGRTAVQLAKWRIEQPCAFPVTMCLQPRLVPGASTGPAVLRTHIRG